jgi:hypothetical protein
MRFEVLLCVLTIGSAAAAEERGHTFKKAAALEGDLLGRLAGDRLKALGFSESQAGVAQRFNRRALLKLDSMPLSRDGTIHVGITEGRQLRGMQLQRSEADPRGDHVPEIHQSYTASHGPGQSTFTYQSLAGWTADPVSSIKLQVLPESGMTIEATKRTTMPDNRDYVIDRSLVHKRRMLPAGTKLPDGTVLSSAAQLVRKESREIGRAHGNQLSRWHRAFVVVREGGATRVVRMSPEEADNLERDLAR